MRSGLGHRQCCCSKESRDTVVGMIHNAVRHIPAKKNKGRKDVETSLRLTLPSKEKSKNTNRTRNNHRRLNSRTLSLRPRPNDPPPRNQRENSTCKHIYFTILISSFEAQQAIFVLLRVGIQRRDLAAAYVY